MALASAIISVPPHLGHLLVRFIILSSPAYFISGLRTSRVSSTQSEATIKMLMAGIGAGEVFDLRDAGASEQRTGYSFVRRIESRGARA